MKYLNYIGAAILTILTAGVLAWNRVTINKKTRK